jgi:hypothetical protein
VAVSKSTGLQVLYDQQACYLRKTRRFKAL